MNTETVNTAELWPGDVVATRRTDRTGNYAERVVAGLQLRTTEWRTVNAVTAVDVSIRRVEFTDGSATSAWLDALWVREVPSAELVDADAVTLKADTSQHHRVPSGTCHLTGRPISQCRHVGGRHACTDLRRRDGGWFTWTEYERIMSL